MTNYEKHKMWRKKYPEKRNKDRRRYYAQFTDAENRRDRWALKEIDMVLKHDIPDRELAEKLGRSVQSIQTARWRYGNRKTA